MTDDDRFRWCIWCMADCWPASEFQTHQPDCPRVTGKYPVTGQGDACCECGAELVGHYRLVSLGPDTDEAVCDDCAIQTVIDRGGAP